MRMKPLIVSFFASMLLAGCAETDYKTVAEATPILSTTTGVPAAPEVTEKTTTEQTEKQTSDKKSIKGSRLFEKVYVPFASRKKGTSYVVVKSFAENSDFKTKITKPTNTQIGSIEVIAANGDYVYFSFYEVKDVDVIMTVSYHSKKKKREVSLENYSSDNSFEYDELTTQVIGEDSKKVSNIKKQREFLFS